MSAARAEVRDTLVLLRSRRMVAGTIIALLVLYVLGLVLPQRPGLDAATYVAWRAAHPSLVAFLEWSGLADVYTSIPMYVALGFFFASLGAVLLDRVPRALRATRRSHGVPLDPTALEARRGTLSLATADPAGALERAAAVLAERGYAIWRVPGALRGVRFRLAPLGFLLFHGSFVLLLAAGISLDLTRFSARVDVAEGEAFDASRGPYPSAPRVPRAGTRYPGLSFRVLAVRPLEEDGSPSQLEVDALVAGELQPRTFRVNEPLTLGTTSLLVSDAGAAPLFSCEVAGEERDGAYVKLKRGTGTVTRYALDACGLDVLARDRGAHAAAGAAAPGAMIRVKPTGRSGLPDGVEVAVRGPDGAVARGVLRPGGSIATPDGSRRLALREVRRYAALQIVDERGGGLLWAGFAMSLAGLVARLVLYRREIAVAADGARLLVAAAQDVVGLGSQHAVLRAIEDAVAGPGAGAGNGRGMVEGG